MLEQSYKILCVFSTVSFHIKVFYQSLTLWKYEAHVWHEWEFPKGSEGPLPKWRQAKQSPSMTFSGAEWDLSRQLDASTVTTWGQRPNMFRFSATKMYTLHCNPVAKDSLSWIQCETMCHTLSPTTKQTCLPILNPLGVFLSVVLSCHGLLTLVLTWYSSSLMRLKNSLRFRTPNIVDCELLLI